VTDQPTPLIGATSDYKMGSSALIRNRGSVAVFIGGSGVTTATGFQLDPGEAIPVDLDDGEIPYGRVVSGTPICHVLEVGV
jgi:hypothetical protein